MSINFITSTVLLLIKICVIDSHRIPQGVLQPVFHKTPIIYRGPVFVIQETINSSEPFIGHVVEGGVEMVRNTKPTQIKSPPTNTPTLVTLINDANTGSQDDAEYFAVLVTPETIGRAQIALSTMITIPLSTLLASISSKIPWVMVLRRENHFDDFKNFVPVSRPTSNYEPFPMQIPVPMHRRTKSHKDEPLQENDRSELQKLSQRFRNINDNAMDNLYSALREADENTLVREFGEEFINIIGKFLRETSPRRAIQFKTAMVTFFNNLADNISSINIDNTTLKKA